MQAPSVDAGSRIGRSAARCSRAKQSTFQMCMADPEYHANRRRRSIERFRTVLGVPLLREGTPIGVVHPARETRAAVHRQADRAGHHLRRPGGDRDRERAAVRRGAGAHARTRAVGRGAARARRSQPGGQFDARSRRPCSTTIVAKATQLSSTEAGAIYVFDEASQEFQLRATYGMDDGR